jgi:hypothetical protein
MFSEDNPQNQLFRDAINGVAEAQLELGLRYAKEFAKTSGEPTKEPLSLFFDEIRPEVNASPDDDDPVPLELLSSLPNLLEIVSKATTEKGDDNVQDFVGRLLSDLFTSVGGESFVDLFDEKIFKRLLDGGSLDVDDLEGILFGGGDEDDDDEDEDEDYQDDGDDEDEDEDYQDYDDDADEDDDDDVVVGDFSDEFDASELLDLKGIIANIKATVEIKKKLASNSIKVIDYNFDYDDYDEDEDDEDIDDFDPEEEEGLDDKFLSLVYQFKHETEDNFFEFFNVNSINVPFLTSNIKKVIMDFVSSVFLPVDLNKKDAQHNLTTGIVTSNSKLYKFEIRNDLSPSLFNTLKLYVNRGKYSKMAYRSYPYHMKDYLLARYKPFPPVRPLDFSFLAVYWWRKAAEQGLAEAQFLLGTAYADGHCFFKNMEKSVYWWLKEAERGHLMARILLEDIGISVQVKPKDSES